MELLAPVTIAAGFGVLVIALSAVKRHLARRFLDEQPTTPLAALHPYVVAAIGGGRRDVVNVALTELVLSRTVAAAADRTPRVLLAPQAPHPLEAALLGYIERGGYLPSAGMDPGITRELDAVQEQASMSGWLRTPASARRLAQWQVGGIVLILVATAAAWQRPWPGLWPWPALFGAAVGILVLTALDSAALRPGVPGRPTRHELARLRQHLARSPATPPSGSPWSPELARRVYRSLLDSSFDVELQRNVPQDQAVLLIPRPTLSHGGSASGASSSWAGWGDVGYSCGGGHGHSSHGHHHGHSHGHSGHGHSGHGHSGSHDSGHSGGCGGGGCGGGGCGGGGCGGGGCGGGGS